VGMTRWFQFTQASQQEGMSQQHAGILHGRDCVSSMTPTFDPHLLSPQSPAIM
jgi:hypothetical protein